MLSRLSASFREAVSSPRGSKLVDFDDLATGVNEEGEHWRERGGWGRQHRGAVGGVETAPPRTPCAVNEEHNGNGTPAGGSLPTSPSDNHGEWRGAGCSALRREAGRHVRGVAGLVTLGSGGGARRDQSRLCSRHLSWRQRGGRGWWAGVGSADVGGMRLN